MELDRVLATAMSDDQARITQISNNLSNVSTPGYKRQQQIASVFNVAFDRVWSPNSSVIAERSRQNTSVLSTHAGPLRSTGRLQDVYVEAGGLLQVTTPEGIAYTRQAALRINAEGKLVNESGFAVNTSAGAVLPSKAFTVNAGGEIIQSGEVVAKLMTFEAQNPREMQAAGDGLYKFLGEVSQTDQGRFKTGFIEGSNVDTSIEMIDMLETVRHFESIQKITQVYAELHEKAARYLGEF